MTELEEIEKRFIEKVKEVEKDGHEALSCQCPTCTNIRTKFVRKVERYFNNLYKH